MEVFFSQKPARIRLPLVLSVPHAGTFIPEDIESELKPGKLPPDDTDWFVNRLYDFSALLQVPLISSNVSRWVIDCNRNPDSTPLYNDGRIITGLCTATDFLGQPIYADERKSVSEAETARRRQLYFDPYHMALQQLLDEVKAQFGSVLLWDCHSIRRSVPSIYTQPFPDLILGSSDGASASPECIGIALSELSRSRYGVSHNHPFKGGYITRHYGKPALQQHALQLEMAKPLYLDDNEREYDESRAGDIRRLLTDTLTALGTHLLQSE